MFVIKDDRLQQAKQCHKACIDPKKKTKNYNNKNKGMKELCLKGDKLLKGEQWLLHIKRKLQSKTRRQICKKNIKTQNT